MSAYIFLQWADLIKYLGIWLEGGRGGKVFKVDCTVNRIKFLGSVLGIIQKYRKVSEEIFWNINSKFCVLILLYEIDSLSLHVDLVHKLLVACKAGYETLFFLWQGMCPYVVCYIFLEVC